jgi:hydrogenase maturation protease
MTNAPAERTPDSIIAADPPPAASTLVIGCGNPLRGDDAVGVEVVRRLALRPLPPEVRCVDTGTSGLEIVLLLRDAEAVVLIDAAASGNPPAGQPGQLHELFSAEILQNMATTSAAAAVSIHSVRWSEALALAQAMGIALPKSLTCFLIEAGSFDYGSPLSPAVEAAAERLVTLLHQLLTTRG